MQESYRIEAISEDECRSIFMDWVLSMPAERDQKAAILAMIERYGSTNADHPMTRVLRAGLEPPARTGRRGGWRARRNTSPIH